MLFLLADNQTKPLYDVPPTTRRLGNLNEDHLSLAWPHDPPNMHFARLPQKAPSILFEHLEAECSKTILTCRHW